jgi:hypothetical protein
MRLTPLIAVERLVETVHKTNVILGALLATSGASLTAMRSLLRVTLVGMGSLLLLTTTVTPLTQTAVILGMQRTVVEGLTQATALVGIDSVLLGTLLKTVKPLLLSVADGTPVTANLLTQTAVTRGTRRTAPLKAT